VKNALLTKGEGEKVKRKKKSFSYLVKREKSGPPNKFPRLKKGTYGQGG